MLFPQVSFSGEIEHDFGGVKAEFFHCLFEEMTRPEYGMFIYPEEAPFVWFPVRVSPLFFACGYHDQKDVSHTQKIRLNRLFILREELIGIIVEIIFNSNKVIIFFKLESSFPVSPCLPT